MRTYRPRWLRTLIKLRHPIKTIKRKTRRRRRYVRPVPVKSLPRPNGRIVEWLTHPELGRGTVLGALPGSMLDVEFEVGGRPPAGVPIEEVRILA